MNGLTSPIASLPVAASRTAQIRLAALMTDGSTCTPAAHAVRAAEQAQAQHEVHHRPRRQQPDPLLTASGQIVDLIHQARGDLSGQHPEPDVAQLVRHATRYRQLSAIPHPPATSANALTHWHCLELGE